MHGLIHLLGFLKEWKLSEISQLTGKTLLSMSENLAKVFGSLWLLSCILFLIVALLYFFKSPEWALLGWMALLLSQFLIVVYWPEAKAGTIPNLIILLVLLANWADLRFTQNGKAEVKTLLASVSDLTNEPIKEEMLGGLPTPVKNWLKKSGVVDKAQVHTVRLKQRGWMRTKSTQKNWMKVDAVQYFTIRQPAFIWLTKVQMMPGIYISGKDKFVAGKGEMLIKLWSVFTLADGKDEKIHQGALQRYLSEICWFPSAALSPYIFWEAIDQHSAKATLRYKLTEGSVVFHFTPEGDFAYVLADRYKGSGNEATLEKWRVDCKAYGEFNGIRMPVKLEVTWQLKNGDFTWYKLEIDQVEYNRSELFSQ